MTLIQISILAFRRAAAVVARAGILLLHFWCIPALGPGDGVDLRRDRATYHI